MATERNRKPPVTRAAKAGADWDQSTKANAVAAMISGHSYGEVTKQTGVPKTTLIRWLGEIGPEAFVKARNGQKTLEELIEELARENMLTLINHTKQARDPEWFKRQNAADLAVMDGVMTDKTVRIVQVLQAREQRRAALASGE